MIPFDTICSLISNCHQTVLSDFFYCLSREHPAHQRAPLMCEVPLCRSKNSCPLWSPCGSVRSRHSALLLHAARRPAVQHRAPHHRPDGSFFCSFLRISPNSLLSSVLLHPNTQGSVRVDVFTSVFTMDACNFLYHKTSYYLKKVCLSCPTGQKKKNILHELRWLLAHIEEQMKPVGRFVVLNEIS